MPSENNLTWTINQCGETEFTRSLAPKCVLGTTAAERPRSPNKSLADYGYSLRRLSRWQISKAIAFRIPHPRGDR